PEHPLVERLIAGQEKEGGLRAFIERMRKESEIQRTAADAEKVGMDTGAVARHPLTGEEVPVWIANYVLMDYGTGAVMGVPARDSREFQLANEYVVPIRRVIRPRDGELEDPLAESYTGEGVLVDSGSFDGMDTREAIRAI